MPKQILVLLLVASALIVTGAPLATFAAGDGYIQLARRGNESGVSLNDAVRQVQRDTGGRVLSAETVSQSGRMVHRIKVLTPSGQVRIVTVDAPSRGR